MKPIEIKDAQGIGTGIYVRSSDHHMLVTKRQMRRIYAGRGRKRVSMVNPEWQRPLKGLRKLKRLAREIQRQP